MKKTLLLIVALFFAVGFASAQDIYFAGNHNGTGKIWKNDSLLITLPDSIAVNLRAMQVANDSSIYSAGHVFDTANFFGRLWLNDSCLFTTDTNNTINRLIVNENGWTAAGSNKVWQNGTLLYEYPLDTAIVSTIYALAIDTITGNLYSGGILTDSTSRACIWQNDTILWQEDTASAIYAIAFDGIDLYAAGIIYDTVGTNGALWRNDSLVLQVENADFAVVAVTDSSLYLGGHCGDSLCIWQDGEILYSHTATGHSSINALVVNESGIYYAGQIDSVGTVWKDGEILYQPEGCEVVNTLSVFPLPPLPLYTLTVEADTTGWGSVSGGGEYHIGDTATIEAIPNIGCEFLFWNDSIADNPRDIVITQDSTFTAYFAQIEYLIQTAVVPDSTGTVTGGGLYHYGDTITIEAIPNIGYEFQFWNDSIADNPRDVFVTQDSTFTAYFEQIEYHIQTAVSPEGSGTVTEGGTYHYGDTLTLEATANLGFVFDGWNDGLADNPRDVIVTQDSIFTALFGVQQCTITTEVTPEGAGTVQGGGVYDYGTTTYLTAQSNTGYVFSQWSDEVIDNPREILVEGDATYTAVFTPLQYQISTAASPEHGGTVEGGGIYDYGTVATLTATPNEYFMFLCWSDGSVANPRNITVTQDASYTALFHQNGTPDYTVTVTTETPYLGTVTGSGVYPEGAVIEIKAIPNANATFAKWDDGNTDNPRSVTVTQDLTFTALFELIPSFTIRVEANDSTMGSTFGGGLYFANTVIIIGATPNEGFYFVGWQDEDMNNPRLVTVTEDAVYTALFSPEPVQTYTVTVYCDEGQGFVIGAGTYSAGSVARLAAIPVDGYQFVKWSDGTTDNPKEILVDQDIVMAAFFNGTGIDEDEIALLRLYPNPTKDNIRLEGLEGANEIKVYNCIGALVKSLTLNGDGEISLSDLPSGLYLIRIDRRCFKVVKQ